MVHIHAVALANLLNQITLVPKNRVFRPYDQGTRVVENAAPVREYIFKYSGSLICLISILGLIEI